MWDATFSRHWMQIAIKYRSVTKYFAKWESRLAKHNSNIVRNWMFESFYLSVSKILLNCNYWQLILKFWKQHYIYMYIYISQVYLHKPSSLLCVCERISWHTDAMNFSPFPLCVLDTMQWLPQRANSIAVSHFIPCFILSFTPSRCLLEPKVLGTDYQLLRNLALKEA